MKNNSRYGMIEVATGDESTFTSSGKDTVKMRKMRKKNEQKGHDDSDDDLKWVEDNLPSDDEPQSSLYFFFFLFSFFLFSFSFYFFQTFNFLFSSPKNSLEDDEEKIARRELQKIN